jgi:hypothetical protein
MIDTPDRQDSGYTRQARHPRIHQDLPGPAATRTRQDELAQLHAVHVCCRGRFAYIDGELPDGEVLPLMRLRYGGSAHRWGTAIYVASKDSYEDQIWFSGSTEEVFDLVCDLHVANANS